MNVDKLSAVSLFSGAGGMDIGFKAAGFETVYANDLDPVACKTFYQNGLGKINPGPLDKRVVIKSNKGVDIIFGGPPCQGFSVAGKMNPNDNRNMLIHDFFFIVSALKPVAFVCENVKALAVLEKWKNVREQIFSVMQDDYQISLTVLNAANFNVPQKRERAFFIGIRKDICPHAEKISDMRQFIEREHSQPDTLGQIIRKLGPAGSFTNSRTCLAKITYAKRPVLRSSPYAGMMFNGAGRPLSSHGYSATLPASMGGNRTPIVDEDEIFHGKTHYAETYHQHLISGKKPLEGIAPGNLRRLTIDECLAIQTFPFDFRLAGSQSSQYRQIGNAVPCNLARAVAIGLKNKISELTSK